ncbi:MAG: hypothetical protein GX605_10450 [Chloroflexi bacterium]|nr:hypothetical protein [Chloroflexota bacterium]
MDAVTLQAILDGYPEEMVFVGPDHTIRYMNRFAVEKYARFGGAALVGRSIFACHNAHSGEVMRQAWARFQAGEDDIVVGQNELKRTHMRAVRDDQARLLGYYEYFRYTAAEPSA